MSDTQLVEVYRAANGLEAQLFKVALEEAGIPTQVTGDSMAAILTPPLWWASPRLLVAEADAARASEILRDLEESQARSRASRKKGSE
jgi:hypothetical protein